MATPTSTLLQYLPAIYQEEPFLGAFLAAFEKVLLGRDDGVPLPAAPDGVDYGMVLGPLGLEQIIASLAQLFDARQAPGEFLPWLATWTAFGLRADLPVAKQRDFLARIIPLYNRRGTTRNLQELLSIFTVGIPTVTERDDEFQVGVHSTVGQNTFVGEAPPHYFHVTVSLPQAGKAVIDRQREITRALIELEKPAHTFCDEPELRFPSMQIGVHSTLGVDTLLGVAGGT